MLFKKTKYKSSGSGFFKKALIVLLIVGVVGGGAYFVATSGILSAGQGACDHEWTEIRQENALVSAADCTHAAVYYKTCAKCGVVHDSYTFEYDDPKGHTVVSEVKPENLISAASCDSAAVYRSYCSVCNETLDSFTHGEALGHDYTEIQKTEYLYTKQTCTTGESYYLACGRCGQKHEEGITFTVKDPLGHNFVEEIHKDHLISSLGCEIPEVYYKSCSICNANNESETFVANPARGHNYIEKVGSGYLVAPKTCTTAAVYAKSCEHCGQKHESETFTYGEPLGHDYQNIEHKDFLVDPASTCGDTPEYYITCTRCKEHKENDETFVGAKLEHQLTDVAEVAATATEHGTKAHKVCSACNAYFDTEGNPITAPEVIHNYEWFENETHTKHYKACTVEGCEAPHIEEGDHTYDAEGCDTTCNGGCGFERESQHVDADANGTCEKCGGNVPAPEVPKDEGNKDEDNFTDWMPL